MPAKLTLAIFIKKAKSIHKDKYEYDKVEYKNSYTKIKIYCKCCQNYFWQTPNKHLTGRGCPKCGNIQKGMVRRYSLIEFIKKVKDLYGNKYLICGKYKTNKTPIKVKCQVCKQIFYPTPNNLLRGSKCPYCKKVISKGEECIQKWLDLNKIKYIFQKKFVDCKDKRMLSFDFYLPDQNVCKELRAILTYIEDSGCKVLDEVLVMGDEDDCSSIVFYGFQQHFLCVDIQVVCGLVQQKQV